MQKASKLVLWYHESFRQKRLKIWMVYICILCNDMSLRSAIKFFEQYKFPTLIKSVFQDFYEKRNLLIGVSDNQALHSSVMSRGEFAWSLKNIPHEALIALSAVVIEDELAVKIKDYLLYDAEQKTSLNGDDLIKLGLSEGKLIGTILKELYIEKINHQIFKREDEITLVESKYLKKLD